MERYEKQLDEIAGNLILGGMVVYFKCLAQLDEILRNSRAKSNTAIRARTKLLQGSILNRMGRRDEALNSLKEALEISDEIPVLRSQILDSLARLFSSTNQLSLAELYFNKALELKREFKDQLGEAISLQGLAIHFEKQGENPQAVDFLKKSLVCHQAAENDPGIANVLSRLAALLIETYHHQPSDRYLKQADRYLKQADEVTPPDLPSFGHNLALKAEISGLVHSSGEQPAILFRRAVRFFRKIEDPYGVGRVHLRWGRHLHSRKDRRGAARHFHEAVKSFEESGDKGLQGEALLALDKVNERTPRKKRIERLKSAMQLAYADGTLPCRQELEERLHRLDEAEYLQIMIQSSSPGMSSLDTKYIAGSREDASILFADLQGYSKYSEKRQPHEVFGILNGLYDEIQKAFDQTQGVVGCHMGDGVMAMFLQRHGEDHVDRALEAGKRIQEYVSQFNAMIVKGGHPSLHMRVGIHCGPSFIGRVGAKNRWTFAAIGATTNLAARLESAAQPDTIMMSKAIYNKLKDKTEIEAAGKVSVKGFSKPTTVYVWKKESR
ncbi:MAG: tetratricopeptide repeat protein [Proteobacteria bacterium]|nr:tetratricopeptide repeat protein [Pseudomonadota bacterium]